MTTMQLPPYFLLIVCAISGCLEVRPAAEPVTVRDSAGIEIVESSAPQWEPGRGWRLSAQPTLQIGVMDGDPMLQFDRIVGMFRLSDGRLVVGDKGSAQLRVFDSAGRPITAYGRRGEGPGELPALESTYRLRGDTIGARSVRRVVYFAPDGTPLRKVTPEPAPEESFANLVRVLEDGSIVSADLPDLDAVVPGVPDDSITLYLHAPTGEFTGPIARFRWIDLAKAAGFTQQVLLSSLVPYALDSTRVLVGRTDAFEIQVLERDGRLRRSIRRPWTATEVTQADREAYLEGRINEPREGGGPPSADLIAIRRRLLEGLPFSTHFAPFDAILLAGDGSLWVRHLDPQWQVAREWRVPVPPRALTWSIFDHSGTWLGEVDTPPRFSPRTITDDEVLGVWMDENDVQYVRIYALIKP